MSLLDDLKKQAEQKDSRNVVGDTARAREQERNWHRLSPKMYLIHSFLKEFAENLNIIKPQDPVDFRITRTLELKGLIRQNFRVIKQDPESLKSFYLCYDLVGSRPLQAGMGADAEAGRFRALLNENGMEAFQRVEGAAKFVFIVEPKVTARFSYNADLDASVILLEVHRATGLWSQRLRYEADAITDQLMEETGKFILGRPSRFMELSGNLLSDETREMLREKLIRDKEHKQKLLEQSQPSSPLETTANRLKSLFKK
jgi:hypothetical protein